MPHLWKEIYVVTEDELVPAWYNTRNTLQSEIDRYKKKEYGIKKVCSGGNGRQMLIAYDSLRADIRNALGDPRKLRHLMEPYYQTDSEAVRYYSTYEFEDQTSLSPKHQEEYITNASVLIACLRLREARERERRGKGGSLKGIVGTLCADVQGFNPVLEQNHRVRHTLPSSEKRFKQVLKDFEKGSGEWKHNYSSLISGKLKNQNSRKVNDPVLEVLNNLFAGQGYKPSRTEVYRQYAGFLGGYIEVLNTRTGEIYDPKDFKPLSDRTILTYLGSWSERIGTYSKRSGDRIKLISNFKPYHSLSLPEYAGSLISVDDRQPPFEYAKGERMWFYNAIDLGSGAFTTWVYGKSKEGIITEFYRQLVRNYTQWGYSLPAGIEAEMNLNSSFTDTFLKPGVLFDDVRIEANNPRGKYIERVYEQLRYELEKDKYGWLARPFVKNEANQGGPGNKVIVPYNDIVQNALRDIEDWNNMPHKVYKDKTRWEVFCEMQHPDLKPTNWKALLPHLGYKTKTSVHTGIIKLQNQEFLLGNNGEIVVGDELIALMKRVEDMDVDVYWLDGNDVNVLKAIVYLNDTCICEAVPKPVYSRAVIERTPQDELNRQIMSAYVATIEGYRKLKMADIEPLLVTDNRPKTLNRKFVMPGLERYEVKEEQPAEMMPTLPDENDADMVPVPNKSFVTSLKNRI